MNLRSGIQVGIPAGLLSDASKSLFEEGIVLVFMKWTALTLAVENMWGGGSSKEKADDLRDEIAAWFYKKREHYVDELEILLDEALTYDFNVQAEDGSPREVADVLVKIYDELKATNTSPTLDRVRALQRAAAAKSQRQVVDLDGAVVGTVAGDASDESDDDDDDMDGDGDGDADMGEDGEHGMEDKRAEPVVDEDGFTLVQKGGRRR